MATLRSSALSAGFDLWLRCANGSLSVTNFLFPFLYHSLHVAPMGSAARTEKHYGDGETTFELQLMAFSDAVRGRSKFPITPADSVPLCPLAISSTCPFTILHLSSLHSLRVQYDAFNSPPMARCQPKHVQ